MATEMKGKFMNDGKICGHKDLFVRNLFLSCIFLSLF